MQSDNLAHLDGEHRVPSETQEERDPGLKTYLSSVTSALGDTFPENKPGPGIVRDLLREVAITAVHRRYGMKNC